MPVVQQDSTNGRSREILSPQPQSILTTNSLLVPPPPVPAPSSPFIANRMISLSTTSITSLIPSLYSLGANQSGSSLINPTANSTSDNLPLISDALARESDVIVSTNITSQAEYKGFAAYVISFLFLFIWMSWSMLPDSLLNSVGIYYYPSRWWALAIPAYVLVLMMYTYVAVASYNTEIKTPPLDDPRTIVDTDGVVITELPEYQKKDIDRYLFASTSGIWDLPLSEVNKVLYQDLSR
ncbi:hypothetical protein OGAPHI_006071 [Ogataea philodendri]|uniref:PIG-P domain-containing protein n=1 Tax=Ogataea philodendri TaxID=1378263 RepID=A0A9P8NYH0_9ASCO|nr:uncharacterized protein OGAPHI_006071 [Ogataea philodendri]KAH3661892.1 hypothetical protein OGAPHI_006071 [Ogataea philodendri]